MRTGPLDEVRNLLGRYCELVDGADWDAVGALFAHGRLVAPDGTELAAGAEQVAAFYRRTVRTYDGSPRTKHLVANTVFTDVRDDAVSATSSYLVLYELRPIIAGRYQDRFAADAGWHFAERRFFVDLAGDLSEHLLTRP